MDAAAGIVLDTAHELYLRANDTSTTSTTPERPAAFKIIGICLAIGSGLFIGASFVLKKYGLLKANEKYNEEAGEGYGYLKNAFWWAGMILMIFGEVLNFVAYAFTDAILVTPLGALSVVICTVLSAIFLKERLSMVGKVACFLCILGSVVIVMNAPAESSVSDIQEMKRYFITPGFLSYGGVIIVGSAFTAFWVGPRYGKRNMLVYISICSWVGGLSVVATQGLGSAIVAQVGGKAQFNQWFTYFLLVFVICTLLTEIIYLNKALNLFNAAMVTPTYYVYFTSTTIITSAVLFQGFKGTVTSIVTVVLGFLTICSGVVLLQLSKSAKDVPDAAVFAGDLDQIHAIAEQEESETEPKADAIRGAAAIIRRFSNIRDKREAKELQRLHHEKEVARLETVSEEGVPQYEWDGLRRRKTTLGSAHGRSMTTPLGAPGTPHPPLGMSHFPTDEELAEADRPFSAGLTRAFGTIRSRASSVLPGHPEYRSDGVDATSATPSRHNSKTHMQSPMHPVQLTDIAMPSHHLGDASSQHDGNWGIPSGQTSYDPGASKHIQFGGERRHTPGSLAPTPPPHGGSGQQTAKRQFSFQNVFKKNRDHDSTDDRPTSAKSTGRPISSKGYSVPHAKTASEEERLGLVQGDSQQVNHSMPPYREEDDADYVTSPSDDYRYDDDVQSYSSDKAGRYGRGITESSGRGRADSGGSSGNERGLGIRGEGPPKPPAHGSAYGTPKGGGGA